MYENAQGYKGSPVPIGQANALSKDRERAPMDNAIALLEESLQNVGRLIESVDIRFGPVCRPSAPAGSVNGPMPTLGGSTIVNMLDTHIQETRRLALRLEDLLARCEL